MSKFKEKVFEIVRRVPEGKVVSYGQVALMAGIPRAAIQVGWVLHISDESDKLPWWRVINNAGRISTTCLEHTAQNQKEKLEKEGVKVTKNLKIDIEKYRFRPNPKFLQNLSLEDEYIFKLMEKYGI
ncbi:hypothetical protein A2716_03035 [candidate division WWE3 bacterium RIFCSPHIGHO2_01_FULL_40_23]|uniref:Methylated-DNA-[protein]-cysteine S-methyltransferase DNA binding domain-containing protein n=1 Tax=candidate division WWE3 bacterium RIFCSPLOWO2_01_FULL_41_18 TaxID=1802625 RepID=A0A1F4VC82_UNCKA|nr:MAG: hypothetical protein A2716_03035 [candidate division WWE3 bacterium RIFCSPHIGHO2_01_FULL_40_23]OGC54805.1 MAG: hypothetical protein A3A78_04990 [candidate division WWE3 bacterium RIFCSPLOWO2_01_FULL_41_18]